MNSCTEGLNNKDENVMNVRYAADAKKTFIFFFSWLKISFEYFRDRS